MAGGAVSVKKELLGKIRLLSLGAIRLWVLLGALLLALSLSAKENPLLKTPVVSIDFSVSGCAYQIRVNDISVYADYFGTPMAAAIPVNEYLKSGDNTFSIHLWSVSKKSAAKLVADKQTCAAKATLQVRNALGGDNYPISTLEYQSKPDDIKPLLANTKGSTPAEHLAFKNGFVATKRGPYQVGPVQVENKETTFLGLDDNIVNKGIKISRSVTLKLPFPKWHWFNGDKITLDKTTWHELTQQYLNIYQALHDKDALRLKPLFSIRQQEMPAAYFQKLEDNDNDVLVDMQKEAKDPDMKPLDFPALQKNGYLHVEGNGRLAYLKSPTGQVPIAFNHISHQGGSGYDIAFAKIKGKWQVVR
jgi:hypothetical protein